MTRLSLTSANRITALVAALFAGALLSQAAVAQRAGGGSNSGATATGSSSSPQQAKVIPTMSTQIYDRLNEAQICMDEEDLECANEILDRVAQIRTLNNYEMAQVWNFRAFVFFEQDDVDGAISAYEEILKLPFEDMPDGMIQSSMRNLAMLYVQTEDYQKGLDTLQQWMDLPFTEPTPDDYYMLGSIHYSMEQYAEGVAPLLEAIRLSNEAGEIGDEQYYQLLYVFYFQLEQTDKVIETLSFMVEHWTKRDWILALAGQLSGQERENETLALYELAYDAGFLRRGTEWVQLANLHLNARAPFKAATLLQKGLDEGVIESTEQNWRLLAQSWQQASDHERAIPAFERASSLADDGNTDRLLAQSLASLARWDECVDAARSALDRGGLDRTDYTYMQLGQCLYNSKRFAEARTAFQEAAKDERRAADARRWIAFVDTQVARERTNTEALRSLEQG